MQATPKAVILMYHRITRTDLDPWGMCVSPENFSAQLACIRRVATPISLLEFVRACESGDLPERAVVVTFDDGYVDNFEVALPLLRDHQVPATLFVATCNIGTGREFWWDRLETLLLAIGTLPGSLELRLASGNHCWDLGNAATYTAEDLSADRGIKAWSAAQDTRLGFFYAVWRTLWPLPDASRSAALDQLADWVGFEAQPSASRRTMTADEIRLMGHGGVMEIGAHTVDHPPLPAHESSVQFSQILESRDRLQQILGFPVTTFAYPHGEYSPETIGILREAGFKCAVTVEQKVAEIDSDAMRLPRFGVRDVDGDAFLDQLHQWFGLPPETASAK
jgi:peptidoglycan/xylan/chitin deacetylase (PgdA/CDA1 family)